MTNTKIAFHMMGDENWTAGSIYLRNLFFALRQTYGTGELTFFLLSPVELLNTQDFTHFIETDAVIPYNRPRRWTPWWVINGAARRLFSRDMVMESVIRRHSIDVVFGPMLVYKCAKAATLSWLPDFQHMHLPGMFSDAEYLSRNRTFLRCAKLATRIILLSEAVREDFESFAPMYAHKVKVLCPVCYIPQSIYDHDLHLITGLYDLPEKFVYLPNQFWKHKNHELVFRAVKILKERGIRVFVVCTGAPVDYRHPTYFSDLWQKLAQWNIRDQIIYLGLVPHEHVLLLMRQSISVLNPSLFEGWGITVDEARSVGKHVLLSDIPAHREQDPPQAVFFDPRNCEDLVSKLEQVWCTKSPGPDTELEIKARSILPGRMCKYAESFMSIVREVLMRRNSAVQG